MNNERIDEGIILQDIWMNYRNGNGITTALNNINHSFERGSLNIVQGPPGSGKSSLIRVIGLIESPTLGKVWLNGIDTSNFDEKQRNSFIRNKIGFVFAHFSDLNPINAIENVTLPMISPNKADAKRLLKKVGFTDYDKYPAELSSEEKLRVSIARALVNNHSEEKETLLMNLQQISMLKCLKE